MARRRSYKSKGKRRTKSGSKSVVRTVKKQIKNWQDKNVELKVYTKEWLGNNNNQWLFTTELTGGDYPDNTDVFFLNGIMPGNAFWERIGNKVKLKSIQLNLSFRNEWLSSNISTETRISRPMHVALVKVKSCDGYSTNPDKNDIFNDTLNDGSHRYNWLSLRNQNNTNMFTVLKEWKFTFKPELQGSVVTAPNTISMGISVRKNIEYYRKLNSEALYSGNDDTIASISKNGYILVVRTPYGMQSANQDRIRYGLSGLFGTVQFKYTDL